MFWNYFGMFGEDNSKGVQSATSPNGGNGVEWLSEAHLLALWSWANYPP